MRVFIVDDDEHLLDVLCSVYTSCGHEVVSSPSAETALRLLSEEARFDLALVDVNLTPGATLGESTYCEGVVVAGECVGRGIPRVWAISGMEPDGATAKKLGTFGVSLLHKPVSIETLLGLLV